MFEATRSHKRYPLFAKATIVKRHETNPVKLITQVSCISKVGLGVYSVEPIAIGSEISIHIGFLNAEGESVEDDIDGRVVWALPQDDFYYMGIFFDEEINPEKQPNLHRHLEIIMEND
jgi:hypothetical protein